MGRMSLGHGHSIDKGGVFGGSGHISKYAGYDDFQHADTTDVNGLVLPSGQTWQVTHVSNVGTVQVLDNIAQLVGTSGTYRAHVTADFGVDNNCRIRARVYGTESATNTQGLIASWTDSNNNIVMWINATAPYFTLYKRVAGVYTELGSGYSGTIGTNKEHNMSIELSGGNIKATVNGRSLTVAFPGDVVRTSRHGFMGQDNASVVGSAFDNFSVSKSLIENMVIADGNSLTYGSFLDNDDPWPQLLYNKDKAGRYVINTAVGSQTTAQMIADYATEIAPLFDSGSNQKLILWEITNDLFFGATATEAFDNIKALGQLGQATGFEVLVVNCLPRSNVGTPGTFEADRQTVNTSIRDDSSFYDVHIDVGADLIIGQAGDELNTTNYRTDKVHLNAFGQQYFLDNHIVPNL